MESTREGLRAMIFYYYKSNLTSKKSHERLMKALGDKAPSIRIVFTWFNEFKFGKIKLEVEDRSGRPLTIMSQEKVELDCTTLEQRAVIRFLNAEGIQTSQICQRMKNIYGESCLSQKNIYKWVNEFKNGRITCSSGFEVLEHPAYSPDLAPSDYFLFGLLKKELKGKRFESNEDVQKVVQDFFHTLPKSAYKEGIYKLPERWRRCIESQGDYFE
ncbi:hypothetical protein LAZ67_X001493 [Cordylochernes scorpioides]|uniref:Mos1 transposase HTH domain-containing protein n=1 Tax=Cordylochernes scorpioides TaxID=51811 RepID=A0ABY6LXD9_9ARAC|nr:hypothetical protein LAZ67_X001493 [Cordylochernes scorpioides]